jgi:hypothetical protein
VPHSKYRSRRRRSVSHRRLIILAVAISSLATALVARSRFFAPEHERLRNVAIEIAKQADSADTSDAFLAVSVRRPNYRHSVIAGGAYDASELRNAIETDAIVAAHYKQLDQSRVKVETVAHDRYVHVSYRKGNQIFWTRNKVLLRQGETILTDGKTQIRARCGNCISEQPLLPTSEAEPDVVEFDRLTEGAPALPDAVADPSLAPALPGATEIPLSAPVEEGVILPPARPFGSGIYGPIASGTPSDPFGPTPPADPPALGMPESTLPPTSRIDVPPLFTPTPPPGAPPAVIGELLVPPTLFPHPPGTPTVPPDVHDPPHSSEVPPGPGEPVPVPEPGTLLLVGASVAALLRTVRSHAKS